MAVRWSALLGRGTAKERLPRKLGHALPTPIGKTNIVPVNAVHVSDDDVQSVPSSGTGYVFVCVTLWGNNRSPRCPIAAHLAHTVENLAFVNGGNMEFHANASG